MLSPQSNFNWEERSNEVSGLGIFMVDRKSMRMSGDPNWSYWDK